MDTRHEVDQLVLELQKVKQEVSKDLTHGTGDGGRGWVLEGQEFNIGVSGKAA